MKNKMKKYLWYGFYIIISNVLYGVLLYLIVTWLLSYSEMFAYLGNLTFIIFALLLDRLIIAKVLQAKFLANEINKLTKQKDRSINHRIIQWQLTYFVSFKTSIFFFYIFVLLFSQIIRFNPSLVSLEFAGFINSIDYSVIILLAFKDFSEEFYKDRVRMKKTLEEYNNLME